MIRRFGGKTGLIKTLCQNALNEFEQLLSTYWPLTDSSQKQEFNQKFLEFVFKQHKMRLLMQLFVCGHDKTLGELARNGFTKVSKLLNGFPDTSSQQIRDFMARGMLVSVISCLDFQEPLEPIIQQLITPKEEPR